MRLHIGQGTGHTFDEPLGLLSDCHRRIEHFLQVLVTVTAHAGGGALQPDYRRALEAALRYFAEAAPRHTADEEVSLFPRLRSTGDEKAAAALALIEQLEHDHDEADGHHAAVDTIVREWLAAGALPEARTAELGAHLERLQALYAAHIRVEDEQVFPAAARALGAAQIQEIGREMAARRNVRVE